MLGMKFSVMVAPTPDLKFSIETQSPYLAFHNLVKLHLKIFGGETLDVSIF